MRTSVRNLTSVAARAAAVSLAYILAATLIAPAANAQSSLVVDNGPFVTNAAWNMTNFSVTDDFTITAPVSISSIRFWAKDNSVAQNFGNYSGTLSWFIHSNSEINRPGGSVASGFSSAVVVNDTGVTYSGDTIRIFQVDVPTDGFTLDSGTYWLRLKDGTPSASGDSSAVQWIVRDGRSGQALRFDPDPVNPTEWLSDGNEDLAFQLLGSTDSLNAETPEPGSIWMFLMLFLPFTVIKYLRRRHFKSCTQG